MTPERMAEIHRLCFPDRPWAKSEFEDLLAKPTTRCLSTMDGFLIAQVIAPEAEILTLAVRPTARRNGHASDLVQRLISGPEIDRIFLEVAESNSPARALYAQFGFKENGRRSGYYARSDGPAEDAVLLEVQAT